MQDMDFIGIFRNKIAKKKMSIDRIAMMIFNCSGSLLVQIRSGRRRITDSMIERMIYFCNGVDKDILDSIISNMKQKQDMYDKKNNKYIGNIAKEIKFDLARLTMWIERNYDKQKRVDLVNKICSNMKKMEEFAIETI